MAERGADPHSASFWSSSRETRRPRALVSVPRVRAPACPCRGQRAHGSLRRSWLCRLGTAHGLTAFGRTNSSTLSTRAVTWAERGLSGRARPRPAGVHRSERQDARTCGRRLGARVKDAVSPLSCDEGAASPVGSIACEGWKYGRAFGTASRDRLGYAHGTGAPFEWPCGSHLRPLRSPSTGHALDSAPRCSETVYGRAATWGW